MSRIIGVGLGGLTSIPILYYMFDIPIEVGALFAVFNWMLISTGIVIGKMK